MSDNEDDTPPEANFFSKRAEFVPKVSAEEFNSVSKLYDETVGDKVKLPEVKGKGLLSQKGKMKNALRSVVPPEEEIISDDDDEGPTPQSTDPSPVRLAPAVKRRLKKQQTQRANELKSIQDENRKILSAADTCVYNEVEEVSVESSENFANFILTVSYMSEISRLRCFEDEKFSTIFPKVADLFKLKASELLLCLGDRNIKVDDTPKSLNMTLHDTIECIPYKGTDADEDDDKMKIFFQSGDGKERICLLVHKLEKMQEIVKRYSEQQKISLETLHFEFDGEKIEGTETPEDLDMESGNCIDVKIVAVSSSLQKRKGQGKKNMSPRKKSSPIAVISVEDDADSNDSDVVLCD